MTILSQARYLKDTKDKSLAPRTDYGAAPKGYVPGAGRGAVGFTTRSDIGPARPAVVPADRSLTAQKDRARQVLIHSRNAVEPNMEDYTNFDRFAGYSQSLFSRGQYDDEDVEADKIYKAIDSRMDSKRKRRREELEQQTWSNYHKKRPRPSEFFAPEKVQLQSLSMDEWEGIPDAVDFASRKRRKVSSRSEKFTPIPEQIIDGSRRGGTVTANISGAITAYPGMDAGHGGLTTIMPVSTGTRTDIFSNANKGYVTDLMQLGKTRDSKLQNRLDRAADDVRGQTVVDPKGYLTDLKSFHCTSETDLSDIQKARQLLQKTIETNRQHPPGWIAAARLEESVGKLAKARKIIIQATEAIGNSENIWLEAARLHGTKQGRAILARAVKRIPRSPKIWIKASLLERDMSNKRAVLRKALEYIPDSVALWKAAVELENRDDARVMLDRAVECVPKSVELWLALSRLETYHNAQRVLNKARKKIPTEPSIWIAAAKLEESNNENYAAIIPEIINKAVQSLSLHKVVIERDQWLEEAWKCEQDGAPFTCQAIVKRTIGIQVEDPDKFDMWKLDAKNFLEKNAIHTAKTIYGHILDTFPTKWKIWWEAANLEKNHGTPETVSAVLKQAVRQCVHAVPLWLRYAKETWKTEGNIAEARKILQNAFAENPDDEEIWLAAHKLEAETKQFESARGVLKLAREKCSTPKVWLKSAVLERTLGNTQREAQLLHEGLELFKDFDKLWMMKAQLMHRTEGPIEARKVCQEAVKNVAFSVNMWLEFARLESETGRIFRARAVLERARSKILKNDRLWLAACVLETERNAQQSVLSKALLDCPKSGRLWAFAIESEPLNQQKAKCFLALDKLNEDVHVYTAVAKFFWRSHKKKQARIYFERAVVNDSSIGDTWAWYYLFSQAHRKPTDVEDVVKRCVEAEPTHGKFWIKISKKPGNQQITPDLCLIKASQLLPDISKMPV